MKQGSVKQGIRRYFSALAGLPQGSFSIGRASAGIQRMFSCHALPQCSSPAYSSSLTDRLRSVIK